MKVNVFITRGEGQNKLLVVPRTRQQPSRGSIKVGWVYYASVSTGDALCGAVESATVEDDIAGAGYALVDTVVPDKRQADELP